MKRKLLFTLLSAAPLFPMAQSLMQFSGCPNNNVAILRAGTNADNDNPVNIYTVNTTTGAPTLMSGPIRDLANINANLQVNGLGLNTTDGFLYGLNTTAIIGPIPFYRIGANSIAEQTGVMPEPALIGSENLAIVNAAAGEVDQLDNYYFSAFSGVLNFSTFMFTPTRIFIGKLSSLSTLPAGTDELSPVYTPISTGDPNAAAYFATLRAPVSFATISTASNTGLRDLVFNSLNGKLYSYVTYPDASNPSQFMGLMIQIDPLTGFLTTMAPPVVLPFASASNEVAGTLLDKNGNFLILFTSGEMYKAGTSAPGVYNGSISLLNGTTGLPSPLRGDMASCGSFADGPLPVSLTYFNAYAQNNTTVVLKWETSTEINTSKFIIERSNDGINWAPIHTVNAAGNSTAPQQYRYDDMNVTGRIIFYRLKSVDIGGAYKYSSIKRIALDAAETSWSFYPNPVRDILYVESTAPFSKALSLQLCDVSGRTYPVSFTTPDINRIRVNTTALPAGTYFLLINDGTGRRSVKKIIK